MAIKLGDVSAIGRAENWRVVPDDRQQKVEVLDGVVVLDFGRFEAGDSFTCSAIFDMANFEMLKKYWIGRTLITITDQSGNVYLGCRVVIKGWEDLRLFEKKYVKVSLEIWRV